MCDRDALLADPAADIRILRLTKEEEKRLVARLENITSLEDLRAMQGRIQAQLGIVIVITPSDNEVRTSRGISIQLQDAHRAARRHPARLRQQTGNCLRAAERARPAQRHLIKTPDRQA